MLISFACERCGYLFEVDAAHAGRKCRCKQCGHIFRVPQPGQVTRSESPDPEPVAPIPAGVARPGRPRAKSKSLPAWVLYGVPATAACCVVCTLVMAIVWLRSPGPAQPSEVPPPASTLLASVAAPTQPAPSAPVPAPAPAPAAPAARPEPPASTDPLPPAKEPPKLGEPPAEPKPEPARPDPEPQPQPAAPPPVESNPAPPPPPPPPPAIVDEQASPLPAGRGEVSLEVTGLVDNETKEVFGYKLGEVVARISRSHRVIARDQGGGRMTFTVMPVGDAKKFADMITFAKITGIEGRVIHLVMNPLAAGDRRPSDADAIGQALFDLRSPMLGRRKDALGRLMRMHLEPARRVEVARAIEPMLQDEDSWGRGDAAKALAVWGGPENTPALVALLNDREFGVRWAVLDTIKALHDPGAAPGVVGAIEKDRGKAVEALKAMGTGAEPAVLTLLKHHDQGIREEACRILQVVGTKKSIPVLEAFIRENNGQGGAAWAALEAIEGMQSLPLEERRPPENAVVARALYDLRSPMPNRRRDAVGRLGHVPMEPQRRLEVSKAVAPLLSDADGGCRGDAARALAVWGGPESTPALVAVLGDPDFGVRWAVLDTIKALHDPAAAEGVAAVMLKERGKAMDALKAMGHGAEPAVIKLLKDPDEGLRADACRVLQVIGTKESVAALRALVERTNGRGGDGGAAREALKQLGATSAE